MAKARSSSGKILSPQKAAAWVRAQQKNGKKIVFTNGVFDLLHSGHVAYLEQARALGAGLLVAMNSDASVRRLKGKDRPLVTLKDRARVIAGLGCVDCVTWFTSNTPVALIAQLKPLLYVKGGDWDVNKIPETPVVKSYGGKLKRLKFVEGRSTTNMIKKAQNRK
ncbi:MAG: D-glycero-beta-D-manno-heptose 1-phosphate adenylyltransferase [Bdellovibrionota bacterium]